MNHYLVHMNQKRFNITIHGIDASVYRRIEDRAKREGSSLNRTIKAILEESLGANARGKSNPFADLCGTLPAAEAALLLATEQDFERIDTEDWL
jgi:hypothetical protein